MKITDVTITLFEWMRLPEVSTHLVRRAAGEVHDLGLVSIHTDEGLVGLHRDGDKAQVRVSVSSDDLVALVAGSLAVPTAVATGRLRVHASPLDLLRLGNFL